MLSNRCGLNGCADNKPAVSQKHHAASTERRTDIRFLFWAGEADSWGIQQYRHDARVEIDHGDIREAVAVKVCHCHGDGIRQDGVRLGILKSTIAVAAEDTYRATAPHS